MRKSNIVRLKKTTAEIRQLLKDANLDFESTVNMALNDYLPKIFLDCPFTADLCVNQKNCLECNITKRAQPRKVQNLPSINLGK